MRVVHFFSLLLLSGAFGLSPASASFKLSGIVANKESDSIIVTYNSNRLAYYPVTVAAVIDHVGRFATEVPLREGLSGYIQAEVRHGDHITEIFLHDGDSLFLSVNAARFDSTLYYVGRGADVQNFVVKHIRERGRLNQYTTRMKNNMGLAPGAFTRAVAAEKNNELAFLDRQGAGLSVEFRAFWMAHFTYYNYFFLQQYPLMHTAMSLRRFTDTIPDSSYAVLKDMPLSFDDDLLNVPPYLLYLSGVFESRLKAAHFAFPVSTPGNAARFIDSVNTLAYTTLPDKSAEYFVAQNLYARIRHQLVSRSKSELEKFRLRWPESEYLVLMERQLTITERLAAGQPAPELELVDDSGSRIKLSDLRGKVVYLSFWSAQCRQCISEMRSDRRVKDIFTNKPVVFAYVSIDDDSVAAQKLARALRLSGPFSWTSGGWYSREAQDYGVQGLPAHFLIDRDGNFALQDPPTPAQKTELIVAISRLF